MPVPLAIPLGLAAGSALAWWASAGAAPADGGARRPAIWLGLLVLGPAAGYLELVANAWANLYLVDVPSALDLVLVVAVAASPPLAERLARRGLERGDARRPLAFTATFALIFAASAVALGDRVSVVTTHAAFHRGLGGATLLEHRAGAALVGAAIAVGLGLLAAARAVTARGASSSRGPAVLTGERPSPTLRG